MDKNLDALKRILERERKSRKAAEAILEEKSRELYHLNESLKTLNESLESKVEERTREIQNKNDQLLSTQEALELKVAELRAASKFKSEFMANMSHELRTPLNSILILSQMLGKNKSNNLTDKQIEYSKVIYDSGSDLLTLINDILDLAKIEAGKIQLQIEEVKISNIKDSILSLFNGVAQEKNIRFNVKIEDGLESQMKTDSVRLQQVLRNFLSNAFKFTESGGNVNLNIRKPVLDKNKLSKISKYKEGVVEFAVTDSGIGIESEKLNLIFEAFQQADGSTSRRYGGTGLGLSISLELATLLGGMIQVESKVGEGSTFSLFLPVEYSEQEALEIREAEISRLQANSLATDGKEDLVNLPEIEDDKNILEEGDRPVLIIEDDFRFAGFLRDYAREMGMKAIVAHQGDKGIDYVSKYNPSVILLDIQLPVVDGWDVLRTIKADAKTADIPVHVFSIMDNKAKGRKLGAISYHLKPIRQPELETVFKTIKKEADLAQCLVIGSNQELPEFQNIIDKHFSYVNQVPQAGKAIDYIKNADSKVIIVADLPFPDMPLVEFLDQVMESGKNQTNKIIFFSSEELSFEEQNKIAEFSNIKFYNNENSLNEGLKNLLQKTSEAEQAASRFSGTQILIVDDEMRNIFAVESVLEEYGPNLFTASNGQEALDVLENISNIDIVLMDIMMPVMDGLEAMRKIREQERFADLPIIALTAKAMKGDRIACMEAGATEYLTKPIDVDLLIETIGNCLGK